MHAHLPERLSSSHQRTNLTYQPQPALCYISKTTALGVTTGQLPAGNMRFKITTPGVTTGRESCVVKSLQYKNIRLVNNQHIKSNVVTLNCILLTANVPVVTPSVVVFEM